MTEIYFETFQSFLGQLNIKMGKKKGGGVITLLMNGKHIGGFENSINPNA